MVRHFGSSADRSSVTKLQLKHQILELQSQRQQFKLEKEELHIKLRQCSEVKSSSDKTGGAPEMRSMHLTSREHDP